MLANRASGNFLQSRVSPCYRCAPIFAQDFVFGISILVQGLICECTEFLNRASSIGLFNGLTIGLTDRIFLGQHFDVRTSCGLCSPFSLLILQPQIN